MRNVQQIHFASSHLISLEALLFNAMAEGEFEKDRNSHIYPYHLCASVWTNVQIFVHHFSIYNNENSNNCKNVCQRLFKILKKPSANCQKSIFCQSDRILQYLVTLLCTLFDYCDLTNFKSSNEDPWYCGHGRRLVLVRPWVLNPPQLTRYWIVSHIYFM